MSHGEATRPVPPRMLPDRQGCPPTFRWNCRVWACRSLDLMYQASSDRWSRPDLHYLCRRWSRRQSIPNLLTLRGDQMILVRSLPRAGEVAPRGPLSCGGVTRRTCIRLRWSTSHVRRIRLCHDDIINNAAGSLSFGLSDCCPPYHPLYTCVTWNHIRCQYLWGQCVRLDEGIS